MKRNLIFWLCVLMCVYFGTHLLYGSRGIYQSRVLQAKIQEAQNRLEALQEEKRLWGARVNALSGRQLDLDQLEESAFQMLNMIAEGDTIVFEEN